MILIISQTVEHSTDQIIDWINYYGMSVKRMNGVDFYKKVKVVLRNDTFEVQVEGIDWEEINAVWFRRWLYFKDVSEVYLKMKSEEHIDILPYKFNEFIKSELKSLVVFFSILSQKVNFSLEQSTQN